MKTKTRRITLLIIALLIMITLAGCKPSGDNNSGTGGGGQPNVNKPLEGDLVSVIDKIYETADFDLNVESRPMDLTDSDSVKFNMGLDDASKIKEAVMSEAMISSQAYSLILARVNDAADAEDVAKAMLNGVDQRKWVCVEADDLRVVTYDDAVLLVMIDSNLEMATSQKLADAFGEICGGDFDFAMAK